MKTSGHDLPRRRSVRLLGYDYSQAGTYFVTLCTYKMDCMFGSVVEGQTKLSPEGAIVEECWKEIPAHFGHVQLDASVIMPNHLHGILTFVRAHTAEVGARHGVPSLEGFSRPVSGSLASVIRVFKQAVTRRIAARDARAHHGVPLQHNCHPDVGARHGVPAQPDAQPRRGAPLHVWQRNYYEHIIRDQDELEKIREYIRTNPLRWACDRHNPARGVLVQDETGSVLPWET